MIHDPEIQRLTFVSSSFLKFFLVPFSSNIFGYINIIGHSAHGPYGDEVEELDWSVGQILTALDKFNLMDNTIIYFSSDNGGHIEEHHGTLGYRMGGYNGIFRGLY